MCVKRFRGGLVFKAHGLLYHSTLGSRAIKKKKKDRDLFGCSPESGDLWYTSRQFNQPVWFAPHLRAGHDLCRGVPGVKSVHSTVSLHGVCVCARERERERERERGGGKEGEGESERERESASETAGDAMRLA